MSEFGSLDLAFNPDAVLEDADLETRYRGVSRNLQRSISIAACMIACGKGMLIPEIEGMILDIVELAFKEANESR